MSLNQKNNKIYYGEYTLKHWINLILKGNIKLPDYQRYFVWNLEKTEDLINAFKEKQFIPPVTIGHFKNNNDSVNLILDGQQRLTSILLAYLGIFPEKTKFLKKKEKGFVDENDDPIDEDLVDNILEWNFNKLVEKGKTKNQIKENILPGNYEDNDFKVDDYFFEHNFLGFSYLVPNNKDEKEQQKYYSKVFRNINIQGQSLLPQESRLALYYLDNDLVKYLNPKFSDKIIVNDTQVDFVRYLALLSQYEKEKSVNSLAKGYSRRMEKYYEEYIYFAVSGEESKNFEKKSQVLREDDITDKYNNLVNTLEVLGLFEKYDSIIDLDITLFGLIYFIVFKGKKVDCSQKEKLLSDISYEIKKSRNNSLHLKSPSCLKYLRQRLESSILIYKEHVYE